MRTSHALAVAATVALAVTGAAAPGSAAPDTDTPKVLARGLVSPLTAAVAHDGTAYVTQNFAGVLTRVRPGRKPRTIYRSEGGNEVGGVSVRRGRVFFTETKSDAQGNPSNSWLKRLNRSGDVRTIANIRRYENRVNPDGSVTYGVQGLSEECAAGWPTDRLGPPSYTGIPDSHPYATLPKKRGTYVADAGMNALLAVSRAGRIRTVAVLPAPEFQITAELASAAGAPDCVVGLTYRGEPVPTDVERGPDGKLYVTTEGGGFGEQMPLGAIYRVAPGSGRTTKVVGGLFTPVGLAVAPNGNMFVSQLFANRISLIRHGSTRVRTFADTPLPAAVEFRRKAVYATTHSLVGPSEEDPTTPPGGRLVRFKR